MLKQIGAIALVLGVAGCKTATFAGEAAPISGAVGRYDVRTVPLPDDIVFSSATYTPSGSVLVEYHDNADADPRDLRLATMADDGSDFRQFFAQRLPERPKDNGIRQMVFPDNRRIFTGDFVIECATSLETCTNPALLPVRYPAEVADGRHISHRWSEIVIGPDNSHIAWTTLLADYSAVVLTGKLVRKGDEYTISDARIVSTIEPLLPDPEHPDGVLPQKFKGGEVKQFVAGGTALSLAGMTAYDIPDSVVQNLATGEMEPVTFTPGYTETTIFSPDERLGIVMTTRFSPGSNPAVLGLLPRPYPDSLNMNLSMLAYTYSVTGVRRDRPGNIGPALITIDRSSSDPSYVGINLNTSPDWVYRSPMSWHPSSKKAMWVEGARGSDRKRVQIVELLDYTAGPAVPARPWPKVLAGSSADLSLVPSLARRSQGIEARVYGRVSGHLDYRRSGGMIEKTYSNFSDDGRHVYSGFERMDADPRGQSTYTAAIDLTGKVPGKMHLTVTFGPLSGTRPATLDFSPNADGLPASRGYAEYIGRRLEVAALVP